MADLLGWHFSNGVLDYNDGHEIKAGITHEHDGELKLCKSGLHASRRPLDALRYAKGNICSRVRLSGEIIKDDDKAVATRREYLYVFDAEEVLRKFARLCALDVIGKWDAPEIVRRYLETGDESMRSAARVVARSAAWSAAWAVAKDAACDAACDAAWVASRYVTWDAQNERLESMLLEACNGGSDGE